MIYAIAILGLFAYYIYQMYMFNGNISEYFSDKKNVLHLIFSLLTMAILMLVIDWSTMEKTFSLMNLNFNYSYLISAVVGWFNGSIFMALMKAFDKTKKK